MGESTDPREDSQGSADDAQGPETVRWECARCGTVIDGKPERCPNCTHGRFVRAYVY